MDTGDVLDGLWALFDFAEHWKTWLKIILFLAGGILIVAGATGSLPIAGWIACVAGGVLIVGDFFWILHDRMEHD